MNKVYLLVISDYEGQTIETIALSKNKALELSEEFVKRWNLLHIEEAHLEEFEIRNNTDFKIIWYKHSKLFKRWRSKDNETLFDIIETEPEHLEIEDIT